MDMINSPLMVSQFMDGCIDGYTTDLKEKGLFDGSLLQKYALAYDTIDIITRELEEFKQHWNTHKIRLNRKISQPPRIPNNLYNMPGLHGNGNDEWHLN
uniref:Uncharacterized protein n=1 Tax=Amphimedon queenslandica TaxID=400682 RepID=A0A1X7TMP1_AMPQE